MILDAMRTHIDAVGVCKYGCLALWNLIDNGSYLIEKQ